MAGDIGKRAAEELVKEAYAALVEARKLTIDNFVRALRIANSAGISDEALSRLTQAIDQGYSRTRIGQLRAGKVGGRDK